MNIEQQKNIAKEVLGKLEILDPNCILAGGAPRDWFLGKTAKDLDFYIHLPKNNLTKYQRQLEGIGITATPLNRDGDCDIYRSMGDLFRVFEYKYKGMDVQIMVMRKSTHESVIPHMGTSVCKVWWKGGDVNPTLDFLLSIHLKMIFKKDDYNAKEKHVAKMQKYFPDFTLVDYKYFDNQLDLTARRLNVHPNRGSVMVALLNNWIGEKELTNE